MIAECRRIARRPSGIGSVSAPTSRASRCSRSVSWVSVARVWPSRISGRPASRRCTVSGSASAPRRVRAWSRWLAAVESLLEGHARTLASGPAGYSVTLRLWTTVIHSEASRTTRNDPRARLRPERGHEDRAARRAGSGTPRSARRRVSLPSRRRAGTVTGRPQQRRPAVGQVHGEAGQVGLAQPRRDDPHQPPAHQVGRRRRSPRISSAELAHRDDPVGVVGRDQGVRARSLTTSVAHSSGVRPSGGAASLWSTHGSGASAAALPLDLVAHPAPEGPDLRLGRRRSGDARRRPARARRPGSRRAPGSAPATPAAPAAPRTRWRRRARRRWPSACPGPRRRPGRAGGRAAARSRRWTRRAPAGRRGRRSSPRLKRRYSRSSASACWCQARCSSSGTLRSSTCDGRPASSLRLSTCRSRGASTYDAVARRRRRARTRRSCRSRCGVDAPAVDGALDQAQPATGPGQGAVVAQRRQVGAAVGHLHPQPVAVDARRHADPGAGVHQGVRDHLGDDGLRRAPPGRRRPAPVSTSRTSRRASTDAGGMGGETAVHTGGVFAPHRELYPIPSPA